MNSAAERETSRLAAYALLVGAGTSRAPLWLVSLCNGEEFDDLTKWLGLLPYFALTSLWVMVTQLAALHYMI
jgi:hypothetical protein